VVLCTEINGESMGVYRNQCSDRLYHLQTIIKAVFIATYAHIIDASIFIGIPEWCVLYSLYKLIACKEPKIDKVCNVYYVYFKIRLNLFDEDIAFRFDVYSSTVSRNFHCVLDILAVKTAPW